MEPLRSAETPSSGGAWRGTALIVEVLIILVVVVACLAVFVRLFSWSYASNAYDQHRAHAITLATSEAERLAVQSNISPGETTVEENGYTTACRIEGQAGGRGVLYSATITVFYRDQEMYSLKTARYVGGAGA